MPQDPRAYRQNKLCRPVQITCNTTRTHTHTTTYTHTHIRTYTHTRIHIHIHKHTHMRNPPLCPQVVVDGCNVSKHCHNAEAAAAAHAEALAPAAKRDAAAGPPPALGDPDGNLAHLMAMHVSRVCVCYMCVVCV